MTYIVLKVSGKVWFYLHPVYSLSLCKLVSGSSSFYFQVLKCTIEIVMPLNEKSVFSNGDYC